MSKNILIIDDEISNLIPLEKILKKEGYNVIPFTEPKKALDHIVDLVYQKTGDQPCRLAYIHAGAAERIPELQTKAAERLNITEEIVADMAVSVAINLGPGALGIVAIPE